MCWPQPGQANFISGIIAQAIYTTVGGRRQAKRGQAATECREAHGGAWSLLPLPSRPTTSGSASKLDALPTLRENRGAAKSSQLARNLGYCGTELERGSNRIGSCFRKGRDD